MTFLGFSSKSWDKAKKKRHDKHIKDDPQFYKKRQARYDKSKKLDKCLKNNIINTGGKYLDTRRVSESMEPTRLRQFENPTTLPRPEEHN